MPVDRVAESAVSHTPGPWRAVGLGSNLRRIHAGAADEVGTEVAVLYVSGPREIDANARAIAAVPDLVQALREVAGDCYILIDDGPHCRFCNTPESLPHEVDCTMHVVLDAIAKAEGRS